jgi:hypothetical protein
MTTTPSAQIGKTIVAACVGSIFAQLRQDDRVVAIDADTAFGKLGARVDPHATGSYWDLAGQSLVLLVEGLRHGAHARVAEPHARGRRTDVVSGLCHKACNARIETTISETNK